MSDFPEPQVDSNARREDLDRANVDPALSSAPDEWLVPDGWAMQPDFLAATISVPVDPPAFQSAIGSESPPYWPAPSGPPVDMATLESEWSPLDGLTWREFELAVGDAFRARGYGVTVTQDGADGGVDLVLERPAERVLVQCKHWNVWKVGVKVVRELYGVMAAEGATGAMVVTSGRFTDEARAFARSVNVQLLDRDDAASMLGLSAATLRPSLPAAVAAPLSRASVAPRCPRCGELMVIRTTRRGQNRGEQFWGCPRYPACRGLVPAAAGASWAAPTGVATWTESATPNRTAAPRRERRRSRRTLVALVVVLAVVLSPVAFVVLLGAITRPVQRAVNLPAAPASVAAPASGPTDSRIVATIPVADRPNQVAVDAAGHKLYVTSLDDETLTVIDTTTRKVLSTVPLDRQPGAIAFEPKSKTLWVTNFNDSSVSLLGTNGSHKATIKVGQGPVGVAVDPGLGKAFVTNSLDKTVSVINIKTRKVTTTKRLPWGLGSAVVDPVKHHLCIVNPMAMKLWYCHDASLKFVGVGGPAGESVAIDSVTHSRYATRVATGTLDVVDGSTGKGTTISVGKSPTGVAVDPASHLAYVADHDTRTILVVQASR